MSASSLFSKAINGTGKSIATAFNSISGTQRLKDRGLERDFEAASLLIGSSIASMGIGTMAGVVVSGMVAGVALPLAGGLVVAAVLGFLPARLHATHLIDKDEHRKNAPKL